MLRSLLIIPKLSAIAMAANLIMLSAALAAAQVAQGVIINPKEFHYCGLTVPIQENPMTGIERIGAQYKDYELLQVQTVIRHGAPIETLASNCPGLKNVVWNCTQTVMDKPIMSTNMDQKRPCPKRLFNNVFDMPEANTAMGTCEFGQLLDWGVKQHRNTGRAMHSAYASMKNIPDKKQRLCSKNVWLYSDNVDRTEASGKILFEHMFPAHPSKRESMYVTPWHQADKSFYALQPWCTSDMCKKNTKAFVDAWFNLSYKATLGRRAWCWWQAACNNITIDTTLENLIKTSDEVTMANNMFLKSYINENSMVTNGALVSPELINLMNYNLELAHANATVDNTRRFVLWSAHDTTLMPLMGHLQIPPNQWTPFASVLNIELWKSPSNEQFIRVLYQGKPVHIPFCYAAQDPMMCPYAEFSRYLDASVVEMKQMGLYLPNF